MMVQNGNSVAGVLIFCLVPEFNDSEDGCREETEHNEVLQKPTC